MPTRFAASINSMPAGASTGISSIVSLTGSAMNLYNRQLVIVRTGLAFEMRVEIVAEFFNEGDGRQRGGVTERTERAAEHILSELTDQHDVAALPHAFMEPHEEFAQPRGAFAAGDAPAAAFMRVEADNPQQGLHHARVLIH